MNELSILWLLAGGAVGALVAWSIFRGLGRSLRERLAETEMELEAQRRGGQTAREELAGARAQLLAERVAATDKIEALLQVEQRLKGSFEAMAAGALDANARRLMQMSQEQLEQQRIKAASELAEKKTAIETLLAPMQESLTRLSAHSRELEVKREGAYTAVLAEIQNIQRSHGELRKETTQLVAALRAPKARGNWGEAILKKCVEWAGMVQHAHFDVEQFVRGENANYRPDLVVKMPNGRTIIVDAKTPLDAFLDANVTEDEAVRSTKLLAHAARVRSHLNDLSTKGYWRQFVDSPDFVVCFLPTEGLFSAALEQDPSLIEYSASSGVLLASPTTLIALLKAVNYGWQQAEIAKNAIAIRDTALSVYNKLAGMHGDFIDLGNRLKSAVNAYNDVLTKVEGRGGIFSVSRKLRELEIGEEELQELSLVAITPKALQAEDWQSTLALADSGEDRDG